MSANCYVIIVFLIYSQFGVIRKPGSVRIVCKTYIFINSNLLPYKNLKQNLKISNRTLTSIVALGKGTIFAQKMIIFCQENADIRKI